MIYRKLFLTWGCVLSLVACTNPAKKLIEELEEDDFEGTSGGQQVGDSCSASVPCAESLACIDDFCVPVGGLGEICTPVLNECDEGLFCEDGYCSELDTYRFCHCLQSWDESVSPPVSTPETLQFTLNGVTFPSTQTGSCSPCQAVPPSDESVTYTVNRSDGSQLAFGLHNSAENPGRQTFYFDNSEGLILRSESCEQEVTLSCPTAP